MGYKNKGLFYRFTDAMQKTGDIMLAYAFQKEQIKRELLEGREREKLVEEITERVLSRIHTTIDITSLRNANKELDDLIRKFE